MVRGKFKVDSYSTSLSQMATGKNDKGVEVYKPVELRTILMSPVYSTDPTHENHTFWKYSPSGKIELGTINPEAWKQFELGKEYYIDFTPASA